MRTWTDWRVAACLAGALILVQASVLYVFGQPLISKSGEVWLWAGEVLSAENSQQISDWYTFSHIIHGFLFYGGLWFLFPRLSFWQRLALSVGIEAAWEIIENTPMVINHYREQALAQGYTGDSIINSICDTLAMVAGFIFAWRAPVWASVSAGLAMEAFVGYSIRDGLTLNVLNLVHQFDFIAKWQVGE
jgi:Protein of unknown function (DUF2585)